MKKSVFLILFVPFIVVAFIFFLPNISTITILNPQGVNAILEKNLILRSFATMFIIVIPVFIAMFYIVFKYHKGNDKTDYAPDWTGNNKIKIALWTIPTIIIIILSIGNWKATHALDPYKTITSNKKQIVIDVVALRWKWLFIYPTQNIATVNFVQLPIDTPVEFRLTSGDSPMNSFWIPSLGGQVYTMQSMETQIHMMSKSLGDFNGRAAEINGDGFSGMQFIARVSTQNDFDTWIASIKKSSKPLSNLEYYKLDKPSENNPKAFYSSVAPDLYNKIMYKYMYPTGSQIKKTIGSNNPAY